MTVDYNNNYKWCYSCWINYYILQGGHTPLHETASQGLVKTVKALIEAGVDVNVTDEVSYIHSICIP